MVFNFLLLLLPLLSSSLRSTSSPRARLSSHLLTRRQKLTNRNALHSQSPDSDCCSAKSTTTTSTTPPGSRQVLGHEGEEDEEPKLEAKRATTTTTSGQQHQLEQTKIKRFSSQVCLSNSEKPRVRQTVQLKQSEQLTGRHVIAAAAAVTSPVISAPTKRKQQRASEVCEISSGMRSPFSGGAGSGPGIGDSGGHGRRHRESSASIAIGAGGARGSASSGRSVQAASRCAKLSTASDTGAASGLLAPDDPMILARRRRPSVCNQGSVNVDQQGECWVCSRVCLLMRGRLHIS